MSNPARIAVTIGLSALLLASCAREPARTPPRPRQPAPKPVQRPAHPALSSAAYVSTAGSIDLLVIRASELALQRTTGVRYHDVAAMMVSAHKGTGAQLSFAGRRLNLLPSATMLPKHQVMMTELEASGDFAPAYKRLMVTVHQDALQLHTNYAARGASPTLRPVAASAVPVMRRHLSLLRAL